MKENNEAWHKTQKHTIDFPLFDSAMKEKKSLYFLLSVRHREASA